MDIGEDTQYYLAKGFRVVAVEANPTVCGEVVKRKAAAISPRPTDYRQSRDFRKRKAGESTQTAFSDCVLDGKNFYAANNDILH